MTELFAKIVGLFFCYQHEQSVSQPSPNHLFSYEKTEEV
jgi:hypothetical protein